MRTETFSLVVILASMTLFRNAPILGGCLFMNILFLCTANVNRSRTAEDFYRSNSPKHQFKSAGLSQKYCQKYGTILCTIELLQWSNKIFVMEDMHVQRIAEHAGESYLNKIEVLHIDDIYQYMQPELIDKLMSNDKLLFLSS